MGCWLLRPWQLPHRSDYGLRGTADNAQWTQPKFISHESISGGYLNDKFCSATGVFAPWKAELTNSEELTQLLNERAENEQRSPPANALCDTEKLCAWAKNYDLYTSQQGALDYKHINDRYIRGKKTVDDWMNKKYQTQNHPHCRYMRCWCWDSLVQIKGIVQQRGVAATTTIILELLEGMDLSPETPLLIVDLVPSRFNEWGLAAWDLQRRTLTQEDKFDRQPDVRFLGLYHNDQAAEMGAACSYHKTQSEKLNARIPDLVKDKFQSQADGLKSLMDEIEEKRDMALAVKQWSSGSGRPSSTTGPAPSKTLRTSASPDWAGEVPINFRKRLSLTAIPVAELELRHSFPG
ncbi:unnamed protein product [Durusdinium trenchii]|uniref:Uncharacterized protein n=1 Tax=Durusdinium trenchii TaxID=1381693 RepID=A0ABP0RAJ7_9DINO